MFFNIANLDTKSVVAILGQDCSFVFDHFRFVDLIVVFIAMPLTWLTVLNVEPYLFSVGLVISVLACGISRSRSRSRRPLTVYSEYRYQNLPPIRSRGASPTRSPTSPVSSHDNAPRSSAEPFEARPRLLRSQSLPPKRRRRRHHRSHRSSVIAPITFTPTVTLQEAPGRDESPHSASPKPMASSIKPPVRTPPVPPPFSSGTSKAPLPQGDQNTSTSKRRSSTPPQEWAGTNPIRSPSHRSSSDASNNCCHDPQVISSSGTNGSRYSLFKKGVFYPDCFNDCCQVSHDISSSGDLVQHIKEIFIFKKDLQTSDHNS